MDGVDPADIPPPSGLCYSLWRLAKANPAPFGVLLMAGWILPFFLIYSLGCLVNGDLLKYLTSFVPFLVAFLAYGCSALGLGLIVRMTDAWKGGHWRRFFIVYVGYVVGTVVSVVATIVMDGCHLVGYFGSDAEGSFGMLYFPSVVLYLFAGIVACTALSILKFVRKS